MYKKVAKWTKNVDVFAQDYLLIPIHDTAHWSLAIICHPGVLQQLEGQISFHCLA
jgi:Ulp1 family protease